MRLYSSIFVAVFFPTIAVAQIPSEAVARPVETSQKTGARSPDELVEAGGILLDRQHFDEAIAAFTEALALDPKHGHAFADRALGYAHTNRLEEARRDLAEADRLIQHGSREEMLTDAGLDAPGFEQFVRTRIAALEQATPAARRA